MSELMLRSVPQWRQETLTFFQHAGLLICAGADGAAVGQISDTVYTGHRAADGVELLVRLLDCGWLLEGHGWWRAGGPGELRLRVDPLWATGDAVLVLLNVDFTHRSCKRQDSLFLKTCFGGSNHGDLMLTASARVSHAVFSWILIVLCTHCRLSTGMKCSRTRTLRMLITWLKVQSDHSDAALQPADFGLRGRQIKWCHNHNHSFYYFLLVFCSLYKVIIETAGLRVRVSVGCWLNCSFSSKQSRNVESQQTNKLRHLYFLLCFSGVTLAFLQSAQ